MGLSIEGEIRAVEADLFRRVGRSPVETILQINADGTATSIRVLSFGEGQPILCLHAASWFAAHWLELCSLLAGYRCHCIDMPGHGLSGVVDYSGRQPRAFQVELFGKVCRALNLRNVPIVGNSLGGMTALWLALDAPELIARLVILGVPATALRGARPDLILSLLSVPYLNRVVLAAPATVLTSRIGMRNALSASAGTALAPELFQVHALVRRRPEFRTTISTWMAATHVWRGAEQSVVIPDHELARLHQPTLFIWGERDVFGGPDIASRAAGFMPNARVEVLSAGHHPQLTSAPQCADLINPFLSSS